jgi:hypothetical protein
MHTNAPNVDNLLEKYASSQRSSYGIPTERTTNGICPVHGFLSFKKHRYEKAN